MFDQVSLIIPNYWMNETLTDMTMACINGCLNNELIGEILLIDDGSPFKLRLGHLAGSELEDLIRVIGYARNRGYASAVNCGLFYAQYDTLVIANNDIEFIQPDWLDHLLKPLDEGYHISSIRTSDSDGFTVEDRYEEDAKFGSIWAMRRSTFEKIGALDQSFGRGYFEDQDYWRRAKDLGLKPVKNHAGLVEHKGKATFNKLTDQTHILRAMFRYKAKWGDKAHLFEVPQTGGVVLVDDYDMANPGFAYALKNRELSLEEVAERWPNLLS